MFVFRNNTVERFFPKGYLFSGYDDISTIPSDSDGYIWFYQVPVKFDSKALSEEILSYIQKITFVAERIPSAKYLIALTMDIIYSVPFTDSDTRVKEAVARYNAALYDLARRLSNVKVIDFSQFTRTFQTNELIDWKFYFLSQMGLNPRLSEAFKEWFSHKLNGISLSRKKCLVLDLDNTLWGGVLGEDGIDGIKIGGDYPGKAFLYFQEALIELSKTGVILTVCSKNNEKDVLEAWSKNPYILLNQKYISAYRINWNNKADNIRELAAELNIGLDSFVFVDDNPAERELVRQMLPQVETPDFPEQPYNLPAFFKTLVERYFMVYSLTDEDLKKTEQYKANALRANEQKLFSDFSEYLRSLELRIEISPATEMNIPRIAQMTQKTNQFNLTTKRYTESDVREFLLKGWRIYCVSVADKFGDSGITGAIFIENGAEGARIDSLLLSCRILGKGIEKAFLKYVLSILRSEGVSRVFADYIPSAKNAQVAGFYPQCGFLLNSVAPNGSESYSLALPNADLTIESYYSIELK